MICPKLEAKTATDPGRGLLLYCGLPKGSMAWKGRKEDESE